MRKYNKRKTRGFSIYEHNIMLNYPIVLNETNSYYDSFRGSTIEGRTIQFETDRDGYIVPSRIYDTPDLVCAFLGDSSVECVFVDKDKRYPYLVGRGLESYFQMRINSLNAAVSGADTLLMIKVLVNKVFLEHPDIVFFCNVKSELRFLLLEDADLFWGGENHKEKIIYKDEIYNAGFKARVLEAINILLAGNVPGRFKWSGNNDSFKPHRRTKQECNNRKEKIDEIFKNDLEVFVKLCKSRNVQPILMTQANRYTETGSIKEYYCNHDMEIVQMPYEDFTAIYHHCNDLVRQIAQEQNVLLIDLDKMIEKKAENLYDAVHYTNIGSERVAQIIVDALRFDKCRETRGR